MEESEKENKSEKEENKSEHEDSKVPESHVAHKAEHKAEHKSVHKIEEDEPSLTLKQSTLWKGGTYILGVLLVISLFTGGFGFGSDGSSGGSAGTGNVVVPPAQAPPTTGSVKVQIDDDDPILGDRGAGISIVEFSDFQCPFCGRAHTGALTELKNSDYFKNGDVNLVYKHFPLNSIHPQAQKAAEGSECARRIGGDDKFWEFHDLLFENQQSLDVASLKTYATQIGIDTSKFNKCLDDGEATSLVNDQTKQATDAGGRGTPYFVLINEDGDTQVISGAVPWTNFEAAINSLL